MQAPHTLIAAVAISAILFASCEKPSVSRSEGGTLFLGTEEATDTFDRAVSPGSRQLILEGFAGDVHLIATDSDVARLTVTRRARGDSPEEARSNLAELDIEETGDEASYRYRFLAARTELSRFDVVGEVPRATPVLVKWKAGNIRIDGLSSETVVQNHSGDVGFAGPSSMVRLATRNGDVSATVQSALPAPDYQLLTANGDATVALPAAASVHVEASTAAGSIRTGDLPFTSERFGPADAGARFKARLGEGTGSVKLTTQHGSILISRFEPPQAPAVPDTVIAAPQVVDTTGASKEELPTSSDTVAAPIL